ncbi:MAG: Stk1 family PASTA domain-containing Ser/Thr kinase [Lachnospiraceae bacterium]|nr:Stk1 family PASTA domain-containing Ser/Thr kinase [Lachnospiraceae bacterium]
MMKMGTVIGDRYEVLEKIGTGGMSDVYRAKDEKLSRMVAVKILKQEFSENENFVQKFRTEAQAAAGLMHPNIVNVYDVGDERGIYYIVMELVDGITLKRYIEEKNRLTVKEAVSISIQVAMGLEAAHNNNIIHRDIKPQNIIISKEGKVKVTDFGIAKAATSNTITSNVMGSVHYTSPEQARGGYSDAMSDIYSLGVTMFEMLTGRVPFNGDTTVAIAIKHIQEPIQSPRVYVPDIPVSVEKIVLKCCQKSPDRRYRTAADLIADLKQSLITPNEDFVRLSDPDEDRATRVAEEEELRQLKESFQEGAAVPPKKKKPAGSGQAASSGSKNGKGQPVKKSTSQPQRKKRPGDMRDDEKGSSGIERMTMVTALVIAILVVLILFVAIGSAFGMFGSSGSARSASSVSSTADTPVVAETGIEIPDVTGSSFAEAKSTLEAKGFKVTNVNDTESAEPKGTVTRMEPAGGNRLESGGTITVYTSTGAGAPAQTQATEAETSAETNTSEVAASEDTTEKMVEVPNIVGKSADAAEQILIAAGLRLGAVHSLHSDETLNTIIRQNPAAGTMMATGSEVSAERSLGPVTYYYEGNVEAPVHDRYIPGMEVQIEFTTADGQVLLQTATTTFPVPVNTHGINASTGTIVWRFTDPETGETVNPPPSLGVTFTEEP